MRLITITCMVLSGLFVTPLTGQWTNRYPKVQGLNHHVYLEGYELPTLTVGPIDPAPSPDGLAVAFSSRGWIWLLDMRSGIASRVTSGGALDFRPTWSPTGSSLAFVRDDGLDTWIVVRNMASGEEHVINTPAIELDPAFSADGEFLYYASAAAGTIDIWHRKLATGADQLVLDAPGTQLRPQPHPDGQRLVFLGKRGGDAIRVRNLVSGKETVLQMERQTSMTRPALSPDGEMVVYNWPTQERYELRLLQVANPTTTIRLTVSDGLPLAPAWSADAKWIYFSEADGQEVFHLKRIPAIGGRVEQIPVHVWDWGEDTGTLRVTTNTAARLSVVDGSGHPGLPVGSQSRFDGQSGRVFFYSPGVVDLTVPTGPVHVAAVRGLATPVQDTTVDITAGEVVEVTLNLQPIWDLGSEGWVSGDHHFHLNYGGPYQLTPDDLVPMMMGEALDVATPLLANLHNRFEDQQLWNTPGSGSTPLIRFGQEVRSHFLGHVGLLGTVDLFWPWIWGPGYQLYGTDDRPNTEALDHARRQGGLSMYVHPFSSSDPFTTAGMARVPIELVVDAVLGRFDLLEVACLWSNELGTSALWYRFLNIGVPIAPSAGTDVMNNLYHTMAIGVTRVYVQDGIDATGSVSFSGRIELPAGGWIAARAHGGEPVWPSMNRYPFAHTAPVWIGHIGSIDRETQRIAATELLRILDVSEQRLHDGYQGIDIPNLQARFSEARI